MCTFTNRFTPAGRITLHKITLGGTASTRFQVRPEFGETRPEREQLATTTMPGEPVEATGDDLAEIPIGQYSIQETIGRDKPLGGRRRAVRWRTGAEHRGPDRHRTHRGGPRGRLHLHQPPGSGRDAAGS